MVHVVYDGRPSYVQTPSQPYIVRPDSRARQEYLPPGGPPIAGGPQAYGWNPSLYDQPGYNAYPAAPAAYPSPAEGPYPHGVPPQQTPAGYAAVRPQSVYGQPPPQGYPAPAPGPTPYGAPVDPHGYPASPVQHHAQQAAPQPIPHVAPESTPQPQIYPQPGVQLDHHQAQVYPQTGAGEPQAQSQLPAQQVLPLQPQPQPQTEPQPSVQAQPQSVQPQQSQAQPQPAAQQSSPTTTQQQSGPPYVYDPNATYPDPNVQAWAQYYAHGGTDPTGSVYFISVPGVKEGPPPAAPAEPTRTQSTDSVTQTASPVAQAAQTAPLHISKAQPDGAASQQPAVAVAQPGAYGASLYASTGPASPVPGEGPPVAGQPYYGLTNQFAGMDIGDGRQNGQAGVGPQVGA